MVSFVNVFALMVFCALVGWLAGLVMQYDDLNEKYGFTQAKQQCEAELPRNQFCQIVVTAKVKEKDDE